MNELEALPLFVIPYSSDGYFLWCAETPSGAITDVCVSGEAAFIRSRKKLFRLGGGIEVLFVQGSGLRDGALCDLHLGSEVHARRARLARWSDADTRAVMKLVAGRFAIEGKPAPVLERYLAFISAWQAACCVLWEFTDGRIVELEGHWPLGKISAYGLSNLGVQRLAAYGLLQRGTKTLAWIPEPAAQYLYLENEDSLVRVNLSAPYHAMPSAGANADWEATALLGALHIAVEHIPDDMAEWAAAHAPLRAALRHRDVDIDVVRAVRLPSDELCVFITAKGATEILETIDLIPFGSPGPLEVETVRCDLDDSTAHGQQKIVLKSLNPGPAAGAYKLTCRIEGRTNSVWISETDSRETDLSALAREFLPVTEVKPDWFEQVIHPLALAFEQKTEPGLCAVRSFGDVQDAYADVFVFAGNDLEALHRTMIGLALTSREASLQIHVILCDQSLLNPASTAVERWSRIYRLAIQVRCYTARSSEAQVIRSTWPNSRLAVYCRAGAVADSADWLIQTQHQLESGGVSMLVGVDAGYQPCKEQTHDPMDLLYSYQEIEAAKSTSDFTVAAVAPNGFLEVDLPRLFTLEAFCVAQAARMDAVISAALRFVSSGTMSHADEFGLRLDLSSLQKIAKSSFASGGCGILNS